MTWFEVEPPFPHSWEEPDMLSLRTILHPTDFSKPSDYAFRLACSLARDHGAGLTLLHVMRPPRVYGGEMGALILPEDHPDSLRDSLEQLRPTDPLLRVDHRLEEGDPAGLIVAVAEEIGCDLIVMGTHGRNGLGRILMGSVAEQVMRKAPCPVLTVKAPMHVASPALNRVFEGAAQG
jgi:nucleotide-binding universal stress UspA family protein